MKRSNSKNKRDLTAFLYERLSRDDDLEGESYSIANQKKLLIKVAKEMGYTNLVHFCDDGISGRGHEAARLLRYVATAPGWQSRRRIRKRPFPPGPQLYRGWSAYRGVLPGIRHTSGSGVGQHRYL